MSIQQCFTALVTGKRINSMFGKYKTSFKLISLDCVLRLIVPGPYDNKVVPLAVVTLLLLSLPFEQFPHTAQHELSMMVWQSSLFCETEQFFFAFEKT